MRATEGIYRRLIDWQRRHGRSHLPWQNTRDPYRVWLSEIMLQQTQVSTVLEYYPRFLARFPTVADLALGHSDEVMVLWSGLGYYSRDRNLHRCAQQVMEQWQGRFPSTWAELQTLPGIGPSTAAAIAAFCFGERVSILDGNVKRVLARAWGFDGDLAQSGAQRQLWDRAQNLLPGQVEHGDIVAYTQGLMDLGASLCSRTKPQCSACPLQPECVAHAADAVAAYPVKTRRVARRHETWHLLAVRNHSGAVALVQRPDTGIWARLWCLPVFADEGGVNAHLAAVGLADAAVDWQTARPHSLTHRELSLRFARVDLPADALELAQAARWVSPAEWPSLGLPAPVRAWLQTQI